MFFAALAGAFVVYLLATGRITVYAAMATTVSHNSPSQSYVDPALATNTPGFNAAGSVVQLPPVPQPPSIYQPGTIVPLPPIN